MNTTRDGEIRRSLKQVETLADELKLVSLNLTVAHAKLRLKDDAFQTVSGSMREMLDTAATTSEKASQLAKRATGDLRAVEDGSDLGDGLELALDHIKELAERIILTVTSIKHGKGIDQRF